MLNELTVEVILDFVLMTFIMANPIRQNFFDEYMRYPDSVLTDEQADFYAGN